MWRWVKVDSIRIQPINMSNEYTSKVVSGANKIKTGKFFFKFHCFISAERHVAMCICSLRVVLCQKVGLA